MTEGDIVTDRVTIDLDQAEHLRLRPDGGVTLSPAARVEAHSVSDLDGETPLAVAVYHDGGVDVFGPDSTWRGDDGQVHNLFDALVEHATG